MKSNFESIINWVIIVLCILVAVADLLDLFENIPFITNKIPAITLTAIGFIAIYLNVENRNRKKEFDTIINKYATKIIDEINIDDDEHKILSKIKLIWDERENDVNNILDDIITKSRIMEYDSFLNYLHEVQKKLWKGYILTRAISSPIDFTLTAINFNGEFVYHPSKKYISGDIPLDSFYGEVLKKKTGLIFNIDNLKSVILLKYLPNDLRTARLTKLHFKEIEKFQLIVSFESHINLVYRLPKQE